MDKHVLKGISEAKLDRHSKLIKSDIAHFIETGILGPAILTTLESIVDECEKQQKLNNFDFWKDAVDLLNDILPKDTEERISKHMEERGFNDNEARLFREYLTKAFDMQPMTAFLKRNVSKRG